MNSLLGESDADCKMFSSVDSEPNSLEDTTNAVVSKETAEIKTKEISCTPSRTLREHEPVELNIPPGKSLSSIAETELLSNHTENSKHGTLVCIDQDSVNTLKQALIDNARLDKEMVEPKKIDESRVDSTDSFDMKLKTVASNTSINANDIVAPKISEAESVTFIHSTVLPVLATENSKNEWLVDNTPHSVPVNMSKTLQDVEATLPVSRIAGSASVVNSSDNSLCSTSVEQANCSVPVKYNSDSAQQKQLQVVDKNESIGEQRISPADKEDSDGHCSENVRKNLRNISVPVTGNKMPVALLTENSRIVLQDGCKEVTAHRKEVKEGVAVVYTKGTTEKHALLVVRRNKNMSPVSEAEVECEVEDTGSDHEEKHVQTPLMTEIGGKEKVVTTGCEM